MHQEKSLTELRRQFNKEIGNWANAVPHSTLALSRRIEEDRWDISPALEIEDFAAGSAGQ